MNKLVLAGAFIISQQEDDTYRLLSYQVSKHVFKGKASSNSHTSLHIPTTSIKHDETPEDAVFRAIHLQTGIPKADLVIARKIGGKHFYRMRVDTSIERHDYVLELNTRYPKTWSYTFQQSDDYSEELSIHMITHHRLRELMVEYRTVEKDIPEFSNVDAT